MVIVAGTMRAAAQTPTTPPLTTLPTPRARSQPVTQRMAQTARSRNPGSTAGTSRRLAQGWSGVIAGRYSVETMDQEKTSRGSVQAGAPRRTHRKMRTTAPAVPRITAGMPMYQNTQCRLIS